MIRIKSEFVELIRTLQWHGFMFNPIEKNGEYYITEQELINFQNSPFYQAITNIVEHD